MKHIELVEALDALEDEFGVVVDIRLDVIQWTANQFVGDLDVYFMEGTLALRGKLVEVNVDKGFVTVGNITDEVSRIIQGGA